MNITDFLNGSIVFTLSAVALLIVFIVVASFRQDRETDKYINEIEKMIVKSDALRGVLNNRAEKPKRKPKNDDDETYVSFEELLGEKPKRKNDEKEKWDSLPHARLVGDTAMNGPADLRSTEDWDSYHHYLQTGVVRFNFRGKDAELSSLLSMDELEQMGITAEDLPEWYRPRVKRNGRVMTKEEADRFINRMAEPMKFFSKRLK